MRLLLGSALALAVLLLLPLSAAAKTSVGTLDCDRADPYTWRDGSGLVFGQGNGQNYSYSVGGTCYAHLTGAIRSQRIRLATLGPNGYTGIPLTAANPEVDFDLSTSVPPTAVSGSAQYTYVLLRKAYSSKVNNGHEYRARIAFTGRTSAGRNVRLKLTKVVSGVESAIGAEYAVPSTVAYFAPDRVFHVRASAVGANPTVLRAKIWAEGQPEPSGWQLEEVDSDPELQGSGRIELLTKVSSGDAALPMDFMFDNFGFWDVD